MTDQSPLAEEARRDLDERIARDVQAEEHDAAAVEAARGAVTDETSLGWVVYLLLLSAGAGGAFYWYYRRTGARRFDLG